MEYFASLKWDKADSKKKKKRKRNLNESAYEMLDSTINPDKHQKDDSKLFVGNIFSAEDYAY